MKGKVLKTIDVSPLWRTDAKAKDAIGNPGESAIVCGGRGKSSTFLPRTHTSFVS